MGGIDEGTFQRHESMLWSARVVPKEGIEENSRPEYGPRVVSRLEG